MAVDFWYVCQVSSLYIFIFTLLVKFGDFDAIAIAIVIDIIPSIKFYRLLDLKDMHELFLCIISN